MEKRVFGIVLTLLGITGLILAAVSFVNGNTHGLQHAKTIVVYTVLGIIFFFAGINLMRGTKDTSSK